MSEELQNKFAQMEARWRDAARYRFIRDNLTRATSLHMDGTSAWSFRQDLWRTGRHPTFDAAIDSMMAAEPHREEA